MLKPKEKTRNEDQEREKEIQSKRIREAKNMGIWVEIINRMKAFHS